MPFGVVIAPRYGIGPIAPIPAVSVSDVEMAARVATKESEMAHERFKSCIDACTACAQECEHCGDACIGQPEMANCARTCRDCSELCWICCGSMSRGSPLAAAVCRVCAQACDACASECSKHKADHCKRCAEACRRCAEECRKMAA
jgi:hypothetical protein